MSNITTYVDVKVIGLQIKKPTLKSKLIYECKKLGKILKKIYKLNSNKIIIYCYYLFVSIPIIIFDGYLGHYDNFNEISYYKDFISILKFYLFISANIKIGYIIVDILSFNYFTNTNLINNHFLSYSRLIDTFWNLLGYFILYIFLCPYNILSFDRFFNLLSNRFFTCIYLYLSFFIKIIDGIFLITYNKPKIIRNMKENLICINLLGISIICYVKLMYWFFKNNH